MATPVRNWSDENLRQPMMRIASSIAVRTLLIATVSSMLLMQYENVGAQSAWVEPQDSRMATLRQDEYAWRLFVALNWPADTVARTADRSKAFGSDAPTVWESWKNANDVYRQDGSDPGSWNSIAPNETESAQRFNSFTPQQQIHAMHIVNGVMVPMIDSLADAKQLREMHMNQKTFEYIRANEFYNVDGQVAWYRQNRTLSFPLGAKEVKAEWRPIAEQERSKYHTIEITAANGKKQRFGLTALHIISKDMPNWFWATFEHVDNPALPANESWQRASQDTFACHAAHPDCNIAPRGIGLEHTVWQYYRLRGTQTRFVDSQGNPTLLANSQLESGTQQHASCMTCHARASIGVVNGKAVRLEPFVINDAVNNSVTPLSAVIKQTYVGAPLADWFYTKANDGPKQRQFMSLDFVWSLSKAQPKVVQASSSSN